MFVLPASEKQKGWEGTDREGVAERRALSSGLLLPGPGAAAGLCAGSGLGELVVRLWVWGAVQRVTNPSRRLGLQLCPK